MLVLKKKSGAPAVFNVLNYCTQRSPVDGAEVDAASGAPCLQLEPWQAAYGIGDTMLPFTSAGSPGVAEVLTCTLHTTDTSLAAL